MKDEIYKKLYFRAFNDLTQLIEQAKQIQQDLEELYLELSEEDETAE